MQSSFRKEGPHRFRQRLTEALDKKQIRPEDFSIEALARATITTRDGKPIGDEWVDSLKAHRKSGRASLMEATGAAVNTSNFSNITGQLIFSKIRDQFDLPELIWDQCVETVDTQFIDGERVPGIGGVGDEFTDPVGEGDPFPMVGLNEEYIDTAKTEKYGRIIPVTREIITMDRTGLLLRRAQDLGKYLAVNLEKRVLDIVTGQTNNYNRNGTSTNTYLTAGAYVNTKTSNALVDQTDIENAELLFSDITDPNTGEPLLAQADTMIVPEALKRTATSLQQANMVRYGDGGSNTFAPYIPTTGLAGEGAGKVPNTYTVLSNAYVSDRKGDTTTWWLGSPKKAFWLMQVWDTEFKSAAENSELAFTNDIVMRWRVDRRDVVQVAEPRYMVQNNA